MNEKPQSVSFGQYTVRLDTHELFKGSRRIKLQPRAVQVLEMLVERRGGTVKTEELMARAWSTTASIDNLHQAIRKIRQALQDSTENPRYIETVPRIGYRFIGLVQPSQPREEVISDDQPLAQISVPATDLADNDGSQPPIRSPNVPQPHEPTGLARRFLRRRRTVATFVLSVALIAVVVVIGWRALRLTSAPQPEPSVQITRSDSAQLPLLSDGRRLYFGDWDNSKFGFKQVLVEGGNAEELHLSVANPDLCDLYGNKFLVRGIPSGGSRHALAPLWIVSPAGGISRRVGDVQVYDAAWGGDGQWIMYSAGPALYTARADGSGKRLLASIPNAGGSASHPAALWWLRPSPNNRLLRFTVTYDGVKGRNIWEVSLDGKHLRPMQGLDGFLYACCGSWSPDGRYYVFEGARDKTTQLWSMRGGSDVRPDERPEPIPNTEHCRGPLFSPDGRKLYAQRTSYNSEVVRYSSATQEFPPLLRDVSANMLAFSGDGQRIAYTSSPEGMLWVAKWTPKTAEITEKRQMTEYPLEVAMPRWSPDGTKIAFMGRTPGTAWRIYLIDTFAGQLKEIPPNGTQQADPDWSKDGKTLVFGPNPAESTQAGAQGSLSFLEVETGRVTSVRGLLNLHSPRWSPDGEHIVAVQSKTQKLMIFDTNLSEWSDLTGPNPTSTGYPCWSGDSQRVYFLSPEKMPGGGTENVVLVVELSSHEVKRFASLSRIRQSSLTFGTWIGLDPNDSLLALRDITRQTIQAFDWPRR